MSRSVSGTPRRRPWRPRTGMRGGHRHYRLTGNGIVSGTAVETHARDVRAERDRRRTGEPDE